MSGKANVAIMRSIGTARTARAAEGPDGGTGARRRADRTASHEAAMTDRARTHAGAAGDHGGTQGDLAFRLQVRQL